jgi:hypothetical protein
MSPLRRRVDSGGTRSMVAGADSRPQSKQAGTAVLRGDRPVSCAESEQGTPSQMLPVPPSVFSLSALEHPTAGSRKLRSVLGPPSHGCRRCTSPGGCGGCRCLRGTGEPGGQPRKPLDGRTAHSSRRIAASRSRRNRHVPGRRSTPVARRCSSCPAHRRRQANSFWTVNVG